MISIVDLSFSYGYEPVFSHVHCAIPDGKKIGIVGENGAGKSTLFKLLTKIELPSDGTIEVMGSISMVPQEVKHDPDLLKATDVYEYVDPAHTHARHHILNILHGLEFDETRASNNLSDLSGGQKTKLALTKAFLSNPNILLLDEPTNFLDTAGKNWVMNFLGKYPKTVLVISHDLALLDKHISQVLYFNSTQHSIETYAGNYTSFLRVKREHDEQLTRQIKNEHQHLQRMQLGLLNLKKLTSDKGVRQRVMLERRIERIKDVLPDLPQELKGIHATFPPPRKCGEVPIRAEHIVKEYNGTRVLGDVSIYVKRGERVALIGPNGVGKTTLIKILTQNLEPDSGQVFHNESLYYGYYSQEFESFDESKTLQETIQNACSLPENKVYPFLGRFLFSYDRMHQKVSTLSGGEKTRLNIAMLMLQEYNLLILDEPTTYLDVLSQRIILEALKDYQGAMILVSHTQEFVAQLRPNRVLLLPQNTTVFWTPELTQKVNEI